MLITMNVQRPLDGLDQFDNTKVSIDLKNNTTITGRMKAFDYNLHILLEDAEEECSGNKTKYGSMLIRGNMIISVCPVKT